MNMTHIRQSRTDSGLGSLVKGLKTFKLFPLRSKAGAFAGGRERGRSRFCAGSGGQTDPHICLILECLWPRLPYMSYMAHSRQSGPDSGLGFQVHGLQPSSRSLFARKTPGGLRGAMRRHTTSRSLSISLSLFLPLPLSLSLSLPLSPTSNQK